MEAIMVKYYAFRTISHTSTYSSNFLSFRTGKRYSDPTVPYLRRPKYMVDRMVSQPVYSKTKAKELVGLIVVMLDEVNSAYTAFALSEPSASKESGSQILKVR